MAFPLGNKPLPGYLRQVGDKIELCFDHTGPTSYTQFSTSTGLGGDSIVAATSGLNISGFDAVEILARDTTGQISATIIMGTAGYGNAVKSFQIMYISQVTATLGGQSQTSGSQIAASTNLSTFSWRIYAICV